MADRSLELTGQRFGRLVVDHRYNTKNPQNRDAVYWICKCDCGREVAASSASLRSGRTKSCGCLKSQEFFPAINKNRKEKT